MAVFVILSLAVAVMAVAVLVLTAVQLWRAVRRLGLAAAGVRERLVPLGEELRGELEVTSVESEALSRSVAQLRDARERRQRTKEGFREGLRRSIRGS